MDEMKKNVLLFMGKVDRGGIESLYLNLIPLLQADFVFHIVHYVDGDNELESDFLDRGCRLHRLSGNRYLHPFKFINSIRSYIRDNSIDIVHTNVGYSSSYCLLAAYKERVPIRIAHSHGSEFGDSANVLNRLFELICKITCHFYATVRINVGEASRRALFLNSDPSVYLPNGINLEKFSFNPRDRQHIRNELSIADDCLTVVCIARLEAVKNHRFLFDIISEIKKTDREVKLLIVGTGSLEKELKNMVKRLDLETEVVFVGPTSQPEIYCSAADCAVMPSLHEGLSLSMIEAQANGLQCYTSTDIDLAVAVTDRISFLPLSAGAKYWANQILSGSERIKSGVLEESLRSFDYRSTASALRRLYKGEVI